MSVNESHSPTPSLGAFATRTLPGLLVLTALLAVLYAISFKEMYVVWNLEDSLYSHGPLIPVVCLGMVAYYLSPKSRLRLHHIPAKPNAVGYIFLISGLLALLLGDYLGFRVFGHLSLIPVLAGFAVIFWGFPRMKLLWFPLFYLFFMIPIPPSLTTGITFRLKIMAAEIAVQLCNMLTFPMVREGSYIYFNSDSLLVGDVCGGLRSLIALCAIGAFAAYVSRTTVWARLVILAFAIPIAIISNVVRIFMLCVVAYFKGSEVAVSPFYHDFTATFIYITGIALFLLLEIALSRFAGISDEEEGEKA